MAKKKKKINAAFSTPVPFLAVKFRRFDWAVLLTGGIILINAVLALGHPYKLDSADPYGFLIWFLLLLGHIPMEIIEFTARLLGVDGQAIESFTQHREALLLGACDLMVLGITWVVMRFYILKRFGAEPLRITMIFLRLIFFWGLFQLMCFVAVKNWSDGKVNPLHRDLKKVSVKVQQQK